MLRACLFAFLLQVRQQSLAFALFARAHESFRDSGLCCLCAELVVPVPCQSQGCATEDGRAEDGAFHLRWQRPGGARMQRPAARITSSGNGRRDHRRKKLTRENEPDEFFASKFESAPLEEKLKDPLVIIGSKLRRPLTRSFASLNLSRLPSQLGVHLLPLHPPHHLQLGRPHLKRLDRSKMTRPLRSWVLSSPVHLAPCPVGTRQNVRQSTIRGTARANAPPKTPERARVACGYRDYRRGLGGGGFALGAGRPLRAFKFEAPRRDVQDSVPACQEPPPARRGPKKHVRLSPLGEGS